MTKQPESLDPTRKHPKPGDGAHDELPRMVLDNLIEGCQVISPEFKYLYVNDAAAAHGRSTREQLLGRTMTEAYPGIEDTEMFAVLRRCMDDRKPRRMENEFTFPDGSKGWFELRFEPAEEGVLILSVDITERKSAEAALQRSNRALAVLSRCNQTLVRAEDERRFMEEVCRVVVETGGYRLAWIGLKDGNDTRSVRPVARAGLDDGYVDQVRATWDESERGAGPVGRAIRTGRPVVARFIATDPEFEPWREDALARGFASCLTLPIRDNGEVLGALAIYAAEPDAFDDAERELLTEMALDLGHGITTLRSRVARREAEARVAHLNAVLRGIRNVDQLITRERDPQELIRKACELLVESRGFSTSCIVLCDGDRVLDSADAGVELKLHALRQMFAEGNLPDCIQRALRQPEVFVRRDPTSSCEECPVSQHYSGERDASAVRLESEGKTFGALLVSLPPGMAADPEELDLLRQVAGDVAFALRSIEIDDERARAGEEVRASAARWSATFDAITDIVCVLSKDHEFIDMNKAGCTALGRPKADIIGRKCFELFHGTESPIMACPCKVAGQSLSPATARHEQNGKTYDLLAWPIPGDDGRQNGFVHIVKDITPEVEASKEKEKLEEQLRLSQRLEAVGRLAGGVAHDFNNLLSVIISYAGFVAEDLRESDPLHADVVEIQNAGQRAAALTRQLLAFSRKQLLEPKVLNLNKVVAGIEKMLRRLLGEDIDIEVHLDELLGSVTADPGQLEQVIMNLAVNARDAMPQGGKLTIETANVELDGGYAEQHVAVKPGRFVMLSVADTGTGMDAETKAQIFDPFFTTKEKGKGTGLGLSTVYGIVKQSGGNIWVYSEPGRGTTFKVYLPRVDAPAVDVKRRPTTTMATGSETVLVVEDEDAVRRLAERILRSAGYRVHAAASGGDALVLCEKLGESIDLLLTDVVMPQMSGRELAERLGSSRPGLKVLYMSGYTDNAIVHHGVLDPGTRFIGKPFAAAELTRKVREVLDEKETGT